MALQEIGYGSEASSATLNNNFNFLLSETQALASTVETNKTIAAANLANLSASMDTQLANLSTSFNNSLSSTQSTLSTSITSATSTLNNKITTLSTSLTSTTSTLDTRLTTLNNSFNTTKTTLNTQITNLNNSLSSTQSTLSTSITNATSNANTSINNCKNLTYQIGEPKLTLSNTLQTGEIWLEGSTVSRSTYSALFSIYGTTYGAGNGSTTFQLPDFRNRALWGSNGFGYLEAGLPNITGFAGYTANAKSGAFSADGSTSPATGAGNTFTGASFDASRSNSIYGKSSTVQPPAIKVRVKTRYQ